MSKTREDVFKALLGARASVLGTPGEPDAVREAVIDRWLDRWEEAQPDPPVRGTKIRCPGCGRSLGDVMASLIRQRGRFKAQRNEARKRAKQAEAAVEFPPHSPSQAVLDLAARREIESLRQYVEHAETAARDFANALDAASALLAAGIIDADAGLITSNQLRYGYDAARQALARHPGFLKDE